MHLHYKQQPQTLYFVWHVLPIELKVANSKVSWSWTVRKWCEAGVPKPFSLKAQNRNLVSPGDPNSTFLWIFMILMSLQVLSLDKLHTTVVTGGSVYWRNHCQEVNVLTHLQHHIKLVQIWIFSLFFYFDFISVFSLVYLFFKKRFILVYFFY